MPTGIYPCHLRVHSPERCLAIVRLADQGVLYSEIARRVGLTTKSQIAGIVWRYRRATGTSRPAACRCDDQDDLDDRHLPCGIAAIDERVRWQVISQGGCRWIDGDPRVGDWQWCGAPVVNHSPYCTEHIRRIWRHE